MTETAFHRFMAAYFGLLVVVLGSVGLCCYWGWSKERGFWMPWKRNRQAGDVRRVKKLILRPLTLDGVTKSFCRAEVVQMWSAGGTLTGFDYTPPGWRTLGWGEFIESVGHSDPRVSLVAPHTSPRAEIQIKKKTGGIVVWNERKVRA